MWTTGERRLRSADLLAARRDRAGGLSGRGNHIAAAGVNPESAPGWNGIPHRGPREPDTVEPTHRHILVLGDQLNRTVGPLASAEPSRTTVLMIRSRAWERRRAYHPQKLVLIRSAMRHFADELRAAGFRVAWVVTDGSPVDALGAPASAATMTRRVIDEPAAGGRPPLRAIRCRRSS